MALPWDYRGTAMDCHRTAVGAYYTWASWATMDLSCDRHGVAIGSHGTVMGCDDTAMNFYGTAMGVRGFLLPYSGMSYGTAMG